MRFLTHLVLAALVIGVPLAVLGHCRPACGPAYQAAPGAEACPCCGDGCACAPKVERCSSARGTGTQTAARGPAVVTDRTQFATPLLPPAWLHAALPPAWPVNAPRPVARAHDTFHSKQSDRLLQLFCTLLV